MFSKCSRPPLAQIVFFLTLLPTAAWGQEWVEGKAICTDVKVGRFGLLRNVHAYNQDGIAVAPIRGVAEILGAYVDYRPPYVVVSRENPDVTIRIETGNRHAQVNREDVDMGARATCYSGIACAPVRFLAENLDVKIDYRADWTDDDYAFSGNPRIVIEADECVVQSPMIAEVGSDDTEMARDSCVILVHEQPPDAVARFVHDMQQFTQHDATLDASFDLGEYGLDWIVRVGSLTSDGKHFASMMPERWTESYPPWAGRDGSGFWSNAAAVYGVRQGRWRLLAGMQDSLSTEECNRLGIPLHVAKELQIVEARTAEEWENTGDQAANDREDRTGEPGTTYFLTLENARTPVHVGGGYYVTGLNFTKAFDYIDRGAKVRGQVLTPGFKDTDKPIHIEMTLTAFDADLRVLDSTTINFYSVPSPGALLPFDATLFDVRLAELACVSIIPKGAWVRRD